MNNTLSEITRREPSSVTRTPMHHAIRGVHPFLIAQLGVLSLTVLLSQLATALLSQSR